jgi:hypothetical protein
LGGTQACFHNKYASKDISFKIIIINHDFNDDLSLHDNN